MPLVSYTSSEPKAPPDSPINNGLAPFAETTWLKRKVRKIFTTDSTNLTHTLVQIVLVFYIFITLPFLVHFYQKPYIITILAIYMAVNGAAFLMAREGKKLAPRLIITYFTPVVVFLLTCLVYPAGTVQAGVAPRMLLLTQAVTPFLIYRTDKLWPILGSLVMNIMLLWLLDVGINHFPWKIEGLPPDNTFIRVTSSLACMLFLALIIYFYKYNSVNKEKEIKGLMNALTRNAIHLSRTNQNLRDSRQQLSHMNETKNKLFSIISHDLRAPLNSFDGFSALVLGHIENLSKDEIQEMTASMQQSFTHVRVLLENLLTWSRSQMNLIESRPKPLPCLEVLQQVADLYQPQAMQKQVLIEVHAEEKLHAFADPDLVATVLRNLVANAVKYCKPLGTVSVKAERTPGGLLRFSVKDDGIGMPEHVVKNLFSMERKVSVPGTANEKGTGLGLLLSADFVKLMGSEIIVDSHENQGSTFSFVLPAYEVVKKMRT